MNEIAFNTGTTIVNILNNLYTDQSALTNNKPF